jgi:hypothetical protein
VSQDPAATSYLLVETRFDGTAERFLADAATLVHTGGRVRLFLAADAVALGIRGASAELREFLDAGGRVWIDEFTLDHRTLRAAPLEAGVTSAGMADVARLLLETGTRVVWH